MFFKPRRSLRALKRLSPACIEALDSRQMLSSNVIRIASYNIEADINGVTTPRSGLYQVLEGIGEEKVQNNVQPIDILGLEETTSNSTTVAPIVSALNTYYNGAAVYAQSTYQATESGGDTADGNGPNAVIYNTSTLNLIASVGVGTPHGSSNGEYRQVVRYEFQPIGDSGTTGVFYIYVSHMKSGSTQDDATARGKEAIIIRDDEATLPAGSSVLYTGDLNSNPPEAEFTTFTAGGQGQAVDQVGFSTSIQYYSDSTSSLEYRDDYELTTQNVDNDTGNINYVSGSFHVFGNNGTVSQGRSVNSGSNTALNSDLVQDGGAFISASSLYGYLATASDHYPVVADYTLGTGTVTGTPSIGSLAASPTTVAVGGSTTLTASNVTESGGPGTVTGVSFYRESNGITGLQSASDTLVGAGTQNGTTWSITTSTSGLTAGSYAYYALAADSNGNSSPTATTTVNVQGVPSIRSLSVSPTSVLTGTTVNLTAGTVTDTGSTVKSVAFYRESNGSGGLQIGSDTLLGNGTQSGITWTLNNVSTSGLAAGTYTFYAVATDASNATSLPASTTLTVTVPPTIGSFSDNPTSVTVGDPTTLTASNVAETNGTISSVQFYLESNSTSGLQIGSDTLVGSGTQNGTNWTISAATTDFAAGSYTYYAVATDSTGISSTVSSATLTVTPVPQPLVDISILASTSPTGTFTGNLTVIPGQTVYYQVTGQLASIGTSNDAGPKAYTISSETAHPGLGTINYDGIQSLIFDLRDSGAFSISFGSDTLSANPSTGDNWAGATGASTGVANGATVTQIAAGLPSGVHGGATSPESILTGSFIVPSTITAGSTSTIAGDFSSTGAGGLAINSNPTTGANATKIVLSNGDPYAYFGFAPLLLTAATPPSLPYWLTGTNATWTPSSQTLEVTGSGVSINEDPGADTQLIDGLPVNHPNIIVDAGQSLEIKPTATPSSSGIPTYTQPTSGVTVHLNGLTINSGAAVTFDQVEAPGTINLNNGEFVATDHAANHGLLVIGQADATSNPVFSIASTGKLDLQDNDLLYHTGSGDTTTATDAGNSNLTGGYDNLTSLEALVQDGRDNGVWDGDGLTSSLAQSQDSSDNGETVQLAVVSNGDLSSPFSTYPIGGDAVNANDIIVKYTYTGDFDLNGKVDVNDSFILGGYYDGGSTSNNEWAFGDTDGNGKLDFNDSSTFNGFFGNGTGAGGSPYGTADAIQL